MEVFGGFMVMMSILGFFLTVLWFILPFVIFSIKGKVDRMVSLLETMDKRLQALEHMIEMKKTEPRETSERSDVPLS
jgi:hypothetical protein